MKSNFITGCIILTIVFGCFLLQQNKIQKEFKNSTQTINLLSQKILDVKKDMFELRADSIESISRRELDNAYNVIEDNKRFIL